jgi:adenosylcobinamide kinase/adenosylcobinamide-phosphate guanylyltransferase
LSGDEILSASITLILGGARSGKSSYAEKMVSNLGSSVLYIATAEAGDAEMAARIAAHRQARPEQWQLLEAPRFVGEALTRLAGGPDVLLLDCLTLLVSNIVISLEHQAQQEIERAVLAEVKAILAAHKKLDVPLVVVSNEVGLGVVPAYSLGRAYRDALGRANQYLASQADCVLFMVAGLPMIVKDGGEACGG